MLRDFYIIILYDIDDIPNKRPRMWNSAVTRNKLRVEYFTRYISKKYCRHYEVH